MGISSSFRYGTGKKSAAIVQFGRRLISFLCEVQSTHNKIGTALYGAYSLLQKNEPPTTTTLLTIFTLFSSAEGPKLQLHAHTWSPGILQKLTKSKKRIQIFLILQILKYRVSNQAWIMGDNVLLSVFLLLR